MSIIKDLYNGNLNPAYKLIKKGGEYEKINTTLIDHIKELESQLNETQKDLLEKITDSIYLLDDLYATEMFIEGFTVGAQLMCDVQNNQSESFI